MNRRRTFSLLAILLLVVTAGCRRDTRVGSEELLDFDEKEQAARIGEILKSPEPETATSPAALGVQEDQRKEQQQQQQEVFEITLTKETPFIQPQPNMQLPAGTLLKITNRDDKTRRFVSTDRTYDSGDIPAGGIAQITLGIKGDFQISDDHVPFVQGYLQVY